METRRLSFQALTYSLWGIFALTLFSGIFLLVHYVPTFAQAFPSAVNLNEQVPFGWVFRRLHAGGGNFLLLLLLIHCLRVFYTGTYKERAGWVWVIEVLLVFGAVWANFTGSFLPLSQEAFWRAAMTLSSLSTLPWLGKSMVDFLRGGRDLGAVALTRFFSLHIGLAALIGLLLFCHHRKGVSRNREEKDGTPNDGTPWIPAVIAGLLLFLVTFSPDWFTDSLRQAANPLSNPEGISPAWYFLFLQEAFSFLNSTYPVFSLFFWSLVLLLLMGLPYIDRNPEKGLLMRPFSLALGSGFLTLIVYFTFLGLASTHYGEKVILPKNDLSPLELRGARVFAQKNCAYCHQVFGRYGRREGPDMAVVLQRNRSPEWVQRFILNARLYQPGTTMPRYEMPLEELEALRAYLVSLDPKKRKFQEVDREILLDYEPPFGVAKREGR